MNRWLLAGGLMILAAEILFRGPSIVEPPVVPDSGPPPVVSPAPPDLHLESTLVVDGLGPITDVAAHPDSDLLYVVEKVGRILVVEGGAVREEPFLDISDRVKSSGNEQGLVSFELHPEFSENRRGFLFYTDLQGDSQLVEVRASSDPGRADPGSFRLILEVPQVNGQYHQSGSIAFAPDGLMWVSIGDGGGIGDPDKNGQNPENIDATIIRVGVDGGVPYEIPSDNSFVDSGDGMAEIWAYGVRNPWRISIDSRQGLIIIPDVGQEGSEEINIVPISDSGHNFGWSITEGTLCYDPDYELEECDTEGITMPVFEYFHQGDGCAVVGGEVYWGEAIPELHGHYFYADFCLGWVRSFAVRGGIVDDHRDWQDDLGRLGNVTSFGTDRHGELLVTNLDGEVWRLDVASG